MAPPKRTTRSAAAKTGKSKSNGVEKAAIKKAAVKKSSKSSKQAQTKRNDPVETPVLAVENNSEATIGNTPFEMANGLFKAGFRPSIDDYHQPSPAGIQFGRRGTIFDTSPSRASTSIGGSFTYSSPRESIFGGDVPSMNSATPFSPTAKGPASTIPRRSSIFQRLASVSAVGGASPRWAPSPGGAYASSPRGIENPGRMASVSGSPRVAKTPGTPLTPRSPFASGNNGPATITVSAATRQQAEGVLARQRLVRESLFELREILTNLNWKVQQFETLVDRAENDVIWDTASANGALGEQDQYPAGLSSGKKVSFDSDV